MRRRSLRLALSANVVAVPFSDGTMQVLVGTSVLIHDPIFALCEPYYVRSSSGAR